MYNNTQYTNPGYSGLYPQQYIQPYSGAYGTYQGYEGYNAQQNTQPQPPPPSEETFSSNNWTTSNYSRAGSKDAVAQEMHQQKAQLIKQREDYVKKAAVLKHELDQLIIQKQELIGESRSPNIEIMNILKQNEKLQDEIQGKLKAINNVIEMLSSIIKDNKSISDLESELVQPDQLKRDSDLSPKSQFDNAFKSQNSNEPKKNLSRDNYCYVHYDTGLHWCRMCDEFPETAKDFLLHLQDKKHRELAKESDIDNTPWHKLPTEQLMPSDEKNPKKRVPIKGLQFFISAPSWYCKLCDIWIGDLHCASQHLKSQAHYQNYENFVSQNPHWEMEWLKDREKSMARKGPQDSSESEGSKKKRKRREKRKSAELFSLKDKKKKKKSHKKRKHTSESSSSSSSSDSSSDDDDDEDRSKSIRVAMRNMKQVQSIMEEDLSAKWSVLEKLVEEHKKKGQNEKLDKEKKEEIVPQEDTLINQWMTVSQPAPKEKMMFDSLKDRMRQKQEHERARLLELDKLRQEKEREEAEKLEQKKRQEIEAAEEEEKKKKVRDQEEFYRIRDKERNQVRFRTNTYRRRRAYSSSEDESEHRFHRKDRSSRDREGSYRRDHSRSRSRSVEQKYDNSEENDKKKVPGPPRYKKLPFIGRMPLFKNKNKAQEDKEEPKELKKESYEVPRKTRFEPGNLPKAFMPKPDVVCFPKLSSIPPLTIPPPAPIVVERVPIPEAPKITVPQLQPEKLMKPPPPPKLDKTTTNLSDDEVLYGSSESANSNMMGNYYQNYTNLYQQNNYQYPPENKIKPPPPSHHSHSMPLQPPPLPPDDDLAMLGICADDMAAQTM